MDVATAESRAVGTASPGLIEFALAVGGFGIGTGEFAIMGLLPDVAHGFRVTEPQAGYVISAYALGVVVGRRSSPSSPQNCRAGRSSSGLCCSLRSAISSAP
jgi:hypothetical protein